jgi:phosphatidylserine/phosphatidylglycerophosphate/cardiolipin synthase-like enzyme
VKDERGLTWLSTAELRSLRDRIATGTIGLPLTSASLQAAGLGDRAWVAAELAGLDRTGAAVALDLVMAERTHGPHPTLDLVWTGPEATASTARDTGVVMREIFAQARERVLIAGYAFDAGAELFEPLFKNMLEHQVRAQMFLNIPRAAPGADTAKHARAYVQQFIIDNWPWPAKYPDFFYDPRTVAPDSVESLHAKCVIVDERLTLIGSANFTDRGRTRNIEIGVLIDDVRFGREVALQWQGLINQRLVQRIVP